MYLVIIYEGERLLCGIAIERGHEMAEYEDLAALGLYVQKHPIRNVVGVTLLPSGLYDLYWLKSLRQLDIQLLRATVQGVLSDSARTSRYEDLIIISNVFEGSANGSNALTSIYNKNLKHDPQNRVFSNFRFVATADNFKLMEALSFVRNKK